MIRMYLVLQQVFYGYQQTYSKVYIEREKIQNNQYIIKRGRMKNEVGGLTLSAIKTYYKTTLINTV